MENGIATISICDATGTLVLTQAATVTAGQLTATVNMQHLAAGLYIATITDAAGKAVRVKCVKN